MKLARYFPILEWGRGYGGPALTNDLVAAAIVTMKLIRSSDEADNAPLLPDAFAARGLI